MNILKSINASFTKFWRWIKETAWVQPLLIVGAIFAIIFSISKFTSWFGTMASGASASYFTSFRCSLENEGKAGIVTEADKITSIINKHSFADYDSYEKALAALNEDKVIETYGKKFYFVIVEESCDGCTNAEKAFETLRTNWNTSGWSIDDDESFRIHSIFADEKSTNDSSYDLEEDKVAFYRYATKFYTEDFWSQAAGRLEVAPYRQNASVDITKYEDLALGESSKWLTPTIYLVDFTEYAFDADRFGISEVVFGFTTGSSDYARATLLQQMWNHIPGKSGTADSTNPFRAEYQN